MQLFGIHNCNTVKKARDWLSAHGIAYEFRNFKNDNVINIALLEGWLNQQSWEKLVNRTGMTWRNLSAIEKASIIDAPSALILMLEKSSIIRRPILVKDGKIICLGFTEATYEKLL